MEHVSFSDDDVALSSTLPWWSASVPRTPVACVRSSIEQNIFSKLWIEVIELLYCFFTRKLWLLIPIRTVCLY